MKKVVMSKNEKSGYVKEWKLSKDMSKNEKNLTLLIFEIGHVKEWWFFDTLIRTRMYRTEPNTIFDTWVNFRIVNPQEIVTIISDKRFFHTEH